MPLLRLEVENVRCVEQAALQLDPRCNYIFGPNGAGKTSLLESVHLLGRGRSFRTRQTARLVRHGAAGLAVRGELDRSAGKHQVAIGFRQGQLSLRVDGGDAGGIAELAALVPVYVIDPKLHQLIEAGPSMRRRFLDWGVFHVEHSFLETWRQYRRALGQRNAALKTRADPATTGAWTRQLAELGERLDDARRRYVEPLSEIVSGIGATLLGGALEVGYRSGWRRGLSFQEALQRAWDRDRTTGITSVGPHRADLDVRMRGAAVDVAASRGEQKLVVAALVLAQVRLWEQSTGDRGVLLVDDPGAELDAAALDRLMQEVGNVRAQLLVTGLSAADLRPVSGYPMFHVEQGRVEPLVV